MVQSRYSILETSGIGEEAKAKIMEVKRRNRFLEKQITLQEEEIQVSFLEKLLTFSAIRISESGSKWPCMRMTFYPISTTRSTPVLDKFRRRSECFFLVP